VRVRGIERQLTQMKRDASASIGAVRSGYTTTRTMVGKSLRSITAGLIFRRRNVRRVNALDRDTLRRQPPHSFTAQIVLFKH
jgi:hypothetical protein